MVMDTNTFYGSKKRSSKRCTTLAEAQKEAEDRENPTSIIVLPPLSGRRLLLVPGPAWPFGASYLR